MGTCPIGRTCDWPSPTILTRKCKLHDEKLCPSLYVENNCGYCGIQKEGCMDYNSMCANYYISYEYHKPKLKPKKIMIIYT
jgi:hypothetical protein